MIDARPEPHILLTALPSSPCLVRNSPIAIVDASECGGGAWSFSASGISHSSLSRFSQNFLQRVRMSFAAAVPPLAAESAPLFAQHALPQVPFASQHTRPPALSVTVCLRFAAAVVRVLDCLTSQLPICNLEPQRSLITMTGCSPGGECPNRNGPLQLLLP